MKKMNFGVLLPKHGRVCVDHFARDKWEIFGNKLKIHAVPSTYMYIFHTMDLASQPESTVYCFSKNQCFSKQDYLQEK